MALMSLINSFSSSLLPSKLFIFLLGTCHAPNRKLFISHNVKKVPEAYNKVQMFGMVFKTVCDLPWPIFPVSFPALPTSTLCSRAPALGSPTSGHTPFSGPVLKSSTTWDSLTPHSFPLKPGAVVPPLGSPSRPSAVNNESGLPWILSEQWDSGAQSGLAQLMQGDRPSHPTEGSFKARPGSGSCSTLHSMRGVMCAIKLASKAKGQGRLVLA